MPGTPYIEIGARSNSCEAVSHRHDYDSLTELLDTISLKKKRKENLLAVHSNKFIEIRRMNFGVFKSK